MAVDEPVLPLRDLDLVRIERELRAQLPAIQEARSRYQEAAKVSWNNLQFEVTV
jgi:hypothetical protein